MSGLLLLFLFHSLVFARHWYNPVANPNATVIVGNARFTVFTDQLLRLEWSPRAKFEDRSTLAILNRRVPLIPFQAANTSSNCTMISTSALQLIYCPTEDGPNGFTSSSLRIDSFTGQRFTWAPGDVDDNLHGTIRTLEGKYSAGRHELNCTLNDDPFDFCTEGLVSKSGWTLVDESTRPLLDGSDWDWVLPQTKPQTDWYFFGYGTNFREALSDYTMLAGKIPLPPKYNFGVYWSRYWAYSDQGEREIVKEYENHNTPLDVMVIDMDWHITFYKEAAQGKVDQAGERVGWTGYTWDKGLFPDPDSFLRWVQQKGLHTTLNLHPASGVQPHELRYPQMATAMGQDPSKQIYVPFDIENKKYATNLFNIMLDPITKQGIDFWWLDWQQHENTSIPNLNPTFWLNHVFFTRFEQTQSTRPVILHRWGGLGNHRYQLGFSGDVTPTWTALNFQPYFTATAANVGFMWSHDIGGHTEPSPPELYTRWIQFGTFSPVFRTHCTKSPDNDRRIWVYPFEYFSIMRDYVELRSRLVPYIYRSARVGHDSGLSFVYPLYYNWPTADAYTASKANQYMFGDDIMVAPITAPVDSITALATAIIWIPPGTWVEWGSSQTFTGPLWINRTYTLREMPVFVQEGAVIPMLPKVKPLIGSAANQFTSVHLKVFTNGDFVTTRSPIYDDDGNNPDYENNYAANDVVFSESPQGLLLEVKAAAISGSYPSFPSHRSYFIEFVGALPPSSVRINGQLVDYLGETDSIYQGDGWTYSASELALTVQVASASTTDLLQITVTKDHDYPAEWVFGTPRCFERLQEVVNLLDSNFPNIFQEDYTAVLAANELQSSIDTVDNLDLLPQLLQKSATQISALKIDAPLKQRLLAYLKCQ